MEGAGMLIFVAVVFYRGVQEVDEVLAQVGLARLLQHDAEGCVEGVDQKGAVVHAAAGDQVV